MQEKNMGMSIGRSWVNFICNYLKINSFNKYIFMIHALTLSDPGYFRQLTIRGGGALKAPPPYDLENYCVYLHHIIHVNFTRCF